MTCKAKTVSEAAAISTVKIKFGKSVSEPAAASEKAISILQNNAAGLSTEQENKKSFNLYKNDLKISDKAYAIGRKKYYLDKELFGPSEELRLKGLSISSEGRDIGDNLRLVLGKYWTVNEDGSGFRYISDVTSAPFLIKDFNFTKDNITEIDDILPQTTIAFGPMDIMFTKGNEVEKEEDKTVFATQQWLLFEAKKAQFAILQAMKGEMIKASPKTVVMDTVIAVKPGVVEAALHTQQTQKGEVEVKFQELLWSSFLKGGTFEDKTFSSLILENRDFFDHAFEIPVPLAKKQVNKLVNSQIKTLFADINLEYKFTIESYEAAITDVPEVLLPNLYVIYSEINNTVTNDLFESHLTLNGSIEKQFLPVRNISRLSTKKFKNIGGDYYEKYAEKIRDFASEQNRGLRTLEDKFKNLGFPISNMSILKKYESKKFMFPMFAEIAFSTDFVTQFSNLLESTRLSPNLISTVSQEIENDIVKKRDFIVVEELIQESLDSHLQSLIEKAFSFDRTELREWDITTWLNNIEAIPQNKTVTFFDNETTETVLDDEFIIQLMKLIGIGKIRKLTKAKFRTYEEMIAGKLCYSETVLYRVEKSLADLNGNSFGKPFQNIYFPNTNEQEVINYIDTQVKYGQSYVYKVFAYQVVIGTKYNYNNLNIKQNIAWMLVTQTPSVKLFEIPYYSFKGTMIDDPPLPPQVDIVPYKNYNNQLLFLFNANVGESILEPIIIEPDDQNKIDTIVKAKNYEQGEKIKFESDDSLSSFQIFRLEKHPKFFKDFSGHMLINVETDVSKITPQKASSASFVDFIKSNRKYWYMFRAIDIHGHISNPTSLIQVELRDERGAVYPIIQEVDFLKDEKKVKTKGFRKYLLIKPAFSQLLVNEQKSGLDGLDSVKDINSVMLGVTDESVWNKDYIVRITSKNTGKIVDIHLKFTNTFVKKENIK